MRPVILTLTVLALTGCEAQTPTPRDVATGEAEGVPATPAAAPLAPDAPTAAATGPGASASPILSGLSRADFESRLESGAGCSLSRGGVDLVVAVVGDGVAKVDGGVVDLAGVPASYNALARGGRFTGGGAVIEFAPAPDLGEGDSVSESATKPVRVTVTSAGRTQRFEAAWTCGS